MAHSKNSEKAKNKFQKEFLEYVKPLNDAVSTKKGEWIVKGFIDIAKNIYTISVDTKVISKIMELILFPYICNFAKSKNYKIFLCKAQNFYPDVSLLNDKGKLFALDIKSTYRKNKQNVNGMTLGAFTGYFRDRKSTKNISFPYAKYTGHFVLGIIYSRADEVWDERKKYNLADLQNIPSVIKDIEFFVQEKYKIASERPGSGNTKNIGSATKIDELITGKGPFAELGEDIFDDYWMYYLTKDMAKAIDLKKAPYKNLTEYKKYKKF